MLADTMPTTPTGAAALETLIANLRSAHALEKQVIAVMEPQLDLFSDHPDLCDRLTRHLAESRDHAKRLESALDACDSSPSVLKDAVLSVMGLGHSSVQGLSDDAVLKAVVADMMTEHLEMATYRMLLVLADMAGRSDLRPALETSLHEEEEMAEWFDQNLERITRRFVELKAVEDARDPVTGTLRADSVAPTVPGAPHRYETPGTLSPVQPTGSWTEPKGS